jgi:hypothetical protein
VVLFLAVDGPIAKYPANCVRNGAEVPVGVRYMPFSLSFGCGKSRSNFDVLRLIEVRPAAPSRGPGRRNRGLRLRVFPDLDSRDHRMCFSWARFYGGLQEVLYESQ